MANEEEEDFGIAGEPAFFGGDGEGELLVVVPGCTVFVGWGFKCGVHGQILRLLRT